MIEATLAQYEFNRGRTLATLKTISEFPECDEILGWRPGLGRAHIAWQLMHIGITEELFATERLGHSKAHWPDLVPRFKGGSTPDNMIPGADFIESILNESRQHWLDFVKNIQPQQLSTIPESMQERGWSLETVLKVLSWHECHHQGQAHITLNLWKNR